MWDRDSGIMFAADLPDRDSAFSILDEVADQVDVIKFNYPLILREGINLLGETKKRYGRPVFADFKVADVPVTNNRIIKLCEEEGVDAVMLHGFIGVEALRRAKKVADKLGLFLVTQLTSPGGADFFEPHWKKFAELAVVMELEGVQAPGNRPQVVKQVREIVGDELVIVSCGIGAQGGKYGGAIAAGADFEIIGRDIYRADSPGDKVESIRREIKPHLNN